MSMPTVWAALRNCCAKLSFFAIKEDVCMKTDIEIAQEAKMKPITQIAAQLGLEEESVIPYGRYKAKIDHRLIHNAKKQGKLILVTAISPTPAGEGKTTTPWEALFSEVHIPYPASHPTHIPSHPHLSNVPEVPFPY